MADDIDKIIDGVLDNEGKSGKVTVDNGGRTQYGISEKANPEAWADGKVTEEEAREIYRKKYVLGPGFDKIPDFHLRAQLVDFGVNSGPALAIMKLQGILGVDVDGVLGPQTLLALSQVHPEAVSTRLVAERVKMIGRICKKDPSQLRYINGWLDRALEFL